MYASALAQTVGRNRIGICVRLYWRIPSGLRAGLRIHAVGENPRAAHPTAVSARIGSDKHQSCFGWYRGFSGGARPPRRAGAYFLANRIGKKQDGSPAVRAKAGNLMWTDCLQTVRRRTEQEEAAIAMQEGNTPQPGLKDSAHLFGLGCITIKHIFRVGK